MTDRRRVSGTIVAKRRKIAKNGSPFLALALLREPGDAETRIVVFNQRLAAEPEALRFGDQVSICGRQWSSSDGQFSGIVGDGYLTEAGPLVRDRTPVHEAEPDLELPLLERQPPKRA